jgi:homoaconitase/3-isopropylmalate dehydratase large subunit
VLIDVLGLELVNHPEPNKGETLTMLLDSHTPNAGGLGMLAIGVGGADAVGESEFFEE